MNPKSLAALLFLLLSANNCAPVLTLPPAEKVQVKLTDQYIELLGEDTMSAFQLTDRSILDCPAIAIYRVAVTPPAGREAGAFDTAMVNALVTRRGNVKRAWIESCPNPYFRNNILRAIVQWKFQPNLRGGTFTDTVVILAVPLKL